MTHTNHLAIFPKSSTTFTTSWIEDSKTLHRLDRWIKHSPLYHFNTWHKTHTLTRICQSRTLCHHGYWSPKNPFPEANEGLFSALLLPLVLLQAVSPSSTPLMMRVLGPVVWSQHHTLGLRLRVSGQMDSDRHCTNWTRIFEIFPTHIHTPSRGRKNAE